MISSATSHWFLSAIYGPPHPIARIDLWESLPAILNSDDDAPHLMIGDFNDILSQAEKQGGRPVSQNQSLKFQSFLNACTLIDIGFVGTTFTCSNIHQGANLIQERLYRACATPSWRNCFPHAAVFNQIRYSSDHGTIVLQLRAISFTPHKPYRFEHMWLLHQDCIPTIQDAWEKPTDGSSAFVLQQKLISTRKSLCRWSKEIFGRLEEHIRISEMRLESAQNRCATASAHQLIQATQYAEIVLQHHLFLLNCKNEYWKTRSRIQLPQSIEVII